MEKRREWWNAEGGAAFVAKMKAACAASAAATPEPVAKREDPPAPVKPVEKPEFTMQPARYAKNCTLIQAPSDDGFKTRAARLAESFGRWSNREKGYICTHAAAMKFVRLYGADWDASIFGERMPPQAPQPEPVAIAEKPVAKPEPRKEYRDITADLCGLDGTRSIPMYSFERVATQFYQGVFDGLRESGMTERKAIEWLQSKEPRWLLDGALGKALHDLGLATGKNALGAVKPG